MTVGGVIGEAFIRIRPGTTGFEQETKSRVSSIVKTVGTALAGAFAVSKGVDLLRDSVAEARESNKVNAQTAAAIKSTGAAANVSADQVGKLATKISGLTGIDDEVIQKGENLLLTFTNVRNEVGKGNDIFDQASKTLVDMGAALGGDASSSAIQLGKALNDPVAGITALTRVGVTFTQQQKDQIKTLVASGKTLDAQKIILGELNKEFGGSAAAQATASDRLKVTIGNIKDQIGGVLVPIIDRASTFLADRLPGAIDTAGRAVDFIRLAVKDFIVTFQDPDVTSSGFFGNIEKAASLTRRTFDAVVAAGRGVVNWFNDLSPVGKKVVTTLAAITVGVYALNVALDANPIGVTVLALVALGVGLSEAYRRSETFRNIVQTVGAVLSDDVVPAVRTVANAVRRDVIPALITFVAFLRSDVGPVVAKIAAYLGEQIGHLATFIADNFADIQEAIGHTMKAIEIIVAVALAPIVLAWRLFGDQILAVVKIAFDQIRLVVDVAIRLVRDVITVVLALINGDWGKAWNALKDIPEAVIKYAAGTVGNALKLVGVAVSAGLELVGKIWSAFWDGLKAAGSGIFDGIVSGITTVLNGVIGAFEGAINLAIRLINLAIEAYNKIPLAPNIDKIGEVHIGRLGESAEKVPNRPGPGSAITAFEHGGMVAGNPGEAVLAWLHAGEQVLPRGQTMPDRLVPVLERLAAQNERPMAHIEMSVREEPDAYARAIVRGLRDYAFEQGTG